MDKSTAANNLMDNYGEMAGLERRKLERLIDSGLSKGFSVKQCYNGIRLCLGMEYGQQEIFSAAEAAEMLEISESELFSKMQEIGAEPIQSERTVFYFPKCVDM